MLSALLITSCTQNKPAQKPKGLNSEFSTRISDTGLKVFRLSATIKQPLQKFRNPADNSNNSKHLTRWLEQELTRHLSLSEFCSTGHTEIERSIGAGFALIRGECNELAPD